MEVFNGPLSLKKKKDKNTQDWAFEIKGISLQTDLF